MTAITNWLFDRSILSYSNERILRERMERAPLPLSQKVWDAAKRSVCEFPKTVLTSLLIKTTLNLLSLQFASLSLSKTDQQISHWDISNFEFVILHPIFEEIVFRGALRSSLIILQDYIETCAPEGFQWAASDYTRILLIQALFASIHLQADYQSTFSAFAQCLTIFLAGSSCTIECETSDSIMASMAFHITNNALVRGITLLA